MVSEDEWDTMEGTGKSMKNALYAHTKGISWTEAMSNRGKKIKPVALAIVKLHKSEGISQSVS